MHYGISLKSTSLLTGKIQTNYKYTVMITKEWATKIVNFMTPGAGVLHLKHGHVT